MNKLSRILLLTILFGMGYYTGHQHQEVIGNSKIEINKKDVKPIKDIVIDSFTIGCEVGLAYSCHRDEREKCHLHCKNFIAKDPAYIRMLIKKYDSLNRKDLKRGEQDSVKSKTFKHKQQN